MTVYLWPHGIDEFEEVDEDTFKRMCAALLLDDDVEQVPVVESMAPVRVPIDDMPVAAYGDKPEWVTQAEHEAKKRK